MEIELVPDPGAGDPAAAAAAAALRREGMARDERAAAYDGAWRRAGVQENIERHPDPVRRSVPVFPFAPAARSVRRP